VLERKKDPPDFREREKHALWKKIKKKRESLAGAPIVGELQARNEEMGRGGHKSRG